MDYLVKPEFVKCATLKHNGIRGGEPSGVGCLTWNVLWIAAMVMLYIPSLCSVVHWSN